MFLFFYLVQKNIFKLIFIFLVLVTLKKGVVMADWNRFSKKIFLENLYKGQNLKVRKFQIHRTLESKVIKRKPTGGGHIVPPPPPSTNRVKRIYIYNDRKLRNIFRPD